MISISGVLPINERIAGGLSGKIDLAVVALVIEDWRIDQRRAGDHSYATPRFGIVKRATTWPGRLRNRIRFEEERQLFVRAPRRLSQLDLKHLDQIVRVNAPAVDRGTVRGDERCDSQVPALGHNDPEVRQVLGKENGASTVSPKESPLVTPKIPFSGKADRGFAIVADIQQIEAFPSIPDPLDTRGRTPDPGAVALIVT